MTPRLTTSSDGLIGGRLQERRAGAGRRIGRRHDPHRRTRPRRRAAHPHRLLRARPVGRPRPRRLILQHQIYGPITTGVLTAAGITRGMRVLDLGSGAGDVALTLAQLVGPEGAVVGVDANEAILDTARSRVAAAGWTNVEFRGGDIGRLDLEGRFDAVVGRWILMYLDDPAGVDPPGQPPAASRRHRRLHRERRPRAPVRTHPPMPVHDDVIRWMTPPAGRAHADDGHGHAPAPHVPRRRTAGAAAAPGGADRRRTGVAGLPLRRRDGPQPAADAACRSAP